MTEKELKRLNRAELLEMLIAQSRTLSKVEEELDETRAKLEEAQAELEKKNIAVRSSGTLAEAALKVSGIFEDADRAAALYIENAKAKEKEAKELLIKAKKIMDKVKKISGE